MVCYDLNDLFTAELAESAEKYHIVITLLFPCGFYLCVLCDLERSGR
jgi:hypothetical protein